MLMVNVKGKPHRGEFTGVGEDHGGLGRPNQGGRRARKAGGDCSEGVSGMTRSTWRVMEDSTMVEEEGGGEGVVEGVTPSVRDPVGVALGVGELVAEGQLDMEEEG